jgi:hypothetical protein
MLAVLFLYRFRWSPSEQEQIRWAVYGVSLSGGLGLLLWIGAPLLLDRSVINANVLGLINLPFPLSLAIAIWRHQLFNIDVIIRRTLVYSLLTGLLAGVYFTTVILLQRFLPAQSTLSVVISTMTIAALFNPLRRRVQATIDRRFYRRRYNAEQILATFGMTLREEVDLERLSRSLVSVIHRTLKPEKVNLWLKPKGAQQSMGDERSRR